VPEEPRSALAAAELFHPAAVLVRKQVRVRARQVVDEAGQSRELASAAVARLLEPTLVQLPLVNLQRYRAAEHLAALLTAVLHRSEMDRQNMVFQQRLIVECPRTIFTYERLLRLT